MLFVTHPIRDSQEKLGLFTYIERTFTEEFNEKKPMEPIYSRNWWDYKWYQDGAPIPKEMHLPKQLLMVCKGIKHFKHDFYFDELRQWVISARFRTFLRNKHLLEGYYQESKLTVVSTKNEPIVEQPYYLLRLFRNDNALIDFDSTPKIVSPVTPFTEYTPAKIYYPDLVFRKGAKVPPLFYVDDPSYWPSFFCNEEIMMAMKEERFLGFDFYTLEEYIKVAVEQERRSS